LLRDISTGQLELITERGIFFPTPYQEIVEVRKQIALEDSQIIVIKDRSGKYRIRRGTDDERSFFLAPYEEIVPFIWSTGIHKDKRTLRLEALDLRPKFMWYEFEARTQDNVELTLGITFFWQIVNVEGMLATTDDATGDICSHARSSIIQAVSQVTLERFLADFNNIVRRVVVESHDPFYSDRGVTLNAVEVRSIACKDPKTQDILNEIIQETTNRLNRLQKQESENEVRLRQMAGDTEVEKAKTNLLELQRENELNQATAIGDAEARRVAAFLAGLGESLTIQNKLEVFNLLRKGEVLNALSQGHAQLYFTPADVNLSIESKQEF
jgi:regulator of protease activity HflC (stomatin/prohibitin superfamily)